MTNFEHNPAVSVTKRTLFALLRRNITLALATSVAAVLSLLPQDAVDMFNRYDGKILIWWLLYMIIEGVQKYIREKRND